MGWVRRHRKKRKEGNNEEGKGEGANGKRVREGRDGG